MKTVVEHEALRKLDAIFHTLLLLLLPFLLQCKLLLLLSGLVCVLSDPTPAPNSDPDYRPPPPPPYSAYHPPQTNYGGYPIYNPHYQPPPQPPPEPQSPQQDNRPKQNCTVVDEAVRAEICVPDFQTKCSSEGSDINTKRLETGEFCYDVTRTVCNKSEITSVIEVCSYTYERQEATAKAKTVEVEFKQECQTQMVTVCQPAPASQFQQGGGGIFQQCNEVAQETCFNIPQVVEKEVDVSMGFPQAKKACKNETVTIPEIKCEDQVETKCQNIPRIVEGPDPVEKCEVVVGEPKCSEVELVLPKQVCQDIVYGFAEDQKHAASHPPQPLYDYPPPPAYEHPAPSPPSYKESPAPKYQIGYRPLGNVPV